MKIKVKTPAKINLALEILRKREDGFHELQSIMQAVNLYDFLTIEVEDRETTVSFSIEELPVFNGDKTKFNKIITDLYKQKFQGKSVFHKELGEIKFFNVGVEKSIKYNTAEMLQLIVKIDQLILNSKYILSEDPYKERKDKIIKFYTLHSKATLDGKLLDIEIKIAEDKFGNKFYFYKNRSSGTFSGKSTVTGTSNVIITDQNNNLNPNIKELRKNAISFYKENLQGKNINHSVLEKIKFTNKGIKKVITSSTDEKKLEFLQFIEKIIQHGEVGEYQPPIKTRDDGIIGFWYITATVNLNEEQYFVTINIAKSIFGNLFYNLNYKIKTVDVLPAGTMTGSPTISNIIITDQNNNLNPEINNDCYIKALSDDKRKAMTIANIIELSGNSENIPYDKANLVYKATELFLEKAQIKNKKIKIFLEKNIPVAAGLAGGSSNAAGTLWGLNQLFKNILTNSELHGLASQMGSDLNFCLEGGTQIATSRGEILSKICTPDLKIAIIKPKDLFISAKEAYVKYAQLSEKLEIKGLEEIKSAIEDNNPEKIANLLTNHLESSILPDYPEIVEIKNYLLKKGCKNVLMSGSGPSVFGIYEEDIDFSDAKENWECFKVSTVKEGVTTC